VVAHLAYRVSRRRAAPRTRVLAHAPTSPPDDRRRRDSPCASPTRPAVCGPGSSRSHVSVRETSSRNPSPRIASTLRRTSEEWRITSRHGRRSAPRRTDGSNRPRGSGDRTHRPRVGDGLEMSAPHEPGLRSRLDRLRRQSTMQSPQSIPLERIGPVSGSSVVRLSHATYPPPGSHAYHARPSPASLLYTHLIPPLGRGPCFPQSRASSWAALCSGV
jgi:hypothetical protein